MCGMEQAKGDTWMLETSNLCIPAFRLDQKQLILMDSGQAGDDLDELLTILRREGQTVRAVLTSHTHNDHTGGHRALRGLYGTELVASLFNAAVLENPLGLRAYFYEDTYHEVLQHSALMGAHVDRLILPGQRSIDIDGAVFQILDLPGHSPEHLGFVTPDGIAYLADLLLSRGQFSTAKLPYITCCELDFASKRRAATWDYTGYLLAHKGYTEQITELVEANLALWEEKLNVILGQLEGEKTMEECVAATAKALCLGGKSHFIRMSVGRSVRAMVQYLVDRGLVFGQTRDWTAYYRRA